MAHAFTKAFDEVMSGYARELVEQEILYVLAGNPILDGPPTDAQRQRATEIADRLEREGKLLDFLEATAPEPCPECGR